jgi:hypothetical protein
MRTHRRIVAKEEEILTSAEEPESFGSRIAVSGF